jgi:hypothetical protein
MVNIKITFSGSSRSKDRCLSEEGRKLISFCKTLHLGIMNSNREGDM